MHSRNSGAMRRKKAALTAFHAECLKKADGGHKAWVQAKADYEQWRVGASNFERTISGALAEVNDIWELRAQERGVAACCRPNSPVPSTRSVPTEMPATPQTSNPNRTTWPSGAHWNTSRAPMTPSHRKDPGVAD